MRQRQQQATVAGTAPPTSGAGCSRCRCFRPTAGLTAMHCSRKVHESPVLRKQDGRCAAFHPPPACRRRGAGLLRSPDLCQLLPIERCWKLPKGNRTASCTWLHHWQTIRAGGQRKGRGRAAGWLARQQRGRRRAAAEAERPLPSGRGLMSVCEGGCQYHKCSGGRMPSHQDPAGLWAPASKQLVAHAATAMPLPLPPPPRTLLQDHSQSSLKARLKLLVMNQLWSFKQHKKQRLSVHTSGLCGWPNHIQLPSAGASWPAAVRCIKVHLHHVLLPLLCVLEPPQVDIPVEPSGNTARQRAGAQVDPFSLDGISVGHAFWQREHLGDDVRTDALAPRLRRTAPIAAFVYLPKSGGRQPQDNQRCGRCRALNARTCGDQPQSADLASTGACFDVIGSVRNADCRVRPQIPARALPDDPCMQMKAIVAFVAVCVVLAASQTSAAPKLLGKGPYAIGQWASYFVNLHASRQLAGCRGAGALSSYSTPERSSPACSPPWPVWRLPRAHHPCVPGCYRCWRPLYRV